MIHLAAASPLGNGNSSTDHSTSDPLSAGDGRALHFGSFALPARRLYLSTEELAAQFGCSIKTIHWRLSKFGSFHGVRPTKMPSRFLAWPLDTVSQILAVANAKPLSEEDAFNISVGAAARPVQVSTKTRNRLHAHLGVDSSNGGAE